MKTFNETVGEKVASVRKKAGMKQNLLAEKINRPQSILSEYESGLKRIYPEVLMDMAKALGVSILELLPVDEENIDNKLMNRFKKIQSLDKSEKEDVLRAIDMILKGTGSK